MRSWYNFTSWMFQCNKASLSTSPTTIHLMPPNTESTGYTGARCTRKSTKEDRVCSICSKSFSKAEHLSRYFRSHTKEKLFQCAFCDKAYTRQYNLDIHNSAFNSNLTDIQVTASWGMWDLMSSLAKQGESWNHFQIRWWQDHGSTWPATQ